nr:glycosyltransferase family 4 protein [Nocardia sp. NRRL S-836]
MRQRIDVVDVGLIYPTAVRTALKAANARRVDGRWVSMWKHSRLARRYAEVSLDRGLRANPCDVVLQIQDLAPVSTPFLVLQDLSYDVLFDHLDDNGRLVHFPSLERGDLERLRDRQRAVYERAAGVVAMSRWFADHLVNVSGVPRERVHVVHPGASAAWTGAEVPDEVRQRRLDGPRRRLLLVGKDFFTKNGPQVLAAVARLRSEVDPEITLTVVGPAVWPVPGEVPPGVTFLGRQPIDAMAGIYDDHDVFVMPSRFEGFGIALVEALARGLPCVARKAFAMPEIVEDGRNGALVATDDPSELAGAIARLLTDDTVFVRTAADAAAVRGHYSWERAADEVVAVAGAVVRQ